MDPEYHPDLSEVIPPSESPGSLPLRRSSSGRLGRRRRWMALIVSSIGLATFFSPLIRTDSPILGRTQWSPLQIVLELHKGTLPVKGYLEPKSVFLTVDALFGCAPMYAMLLVILAAALLLPRVEVIALCAGMAGAAAYGEAKWGYSDLQDVLYGAPDAFVSGNRVHAGHRPDRTVGLLAQPRIACFRSPGLPERPLKNDEPPSWPCNPRKLRRIPLPDHAIASRPIGSNASWLVLRSTSIRTCEPCSTSPSRIFMASGSCTMRCSARFSGRAP